jgi:hypothetical protein
MIERLKAAGVYGLAIVLFIVALPLSVISFAITAQLMMLFLGIGLMLAFVGYIVLLPATVAASLTGNQDNPKFVFGAAAVVAALLIAGLAWFSLDQRAKSDAIQARFIDEVRAGDKILCDHPDASGSRPTYFPAEWLRDTVQVHGWTCWAGGDDVYHPRDEAPFLDRFEFPYE